jgi:hypothetical protein
MDATRQDPKLPHDLRSVCLIISHMYDIVPTTCHIIANGVSHVSVYQLCVCFGKVGLYRYRLQGYTFLVGTIAYIRYNIT